MPISRFYNQERSSTSSVCYFHPNYANFHITYSLWVLWSFSENMIFIEHFENYNLLMKSRLEVEHKVVKESNDLSCLHVFYDHDLLQSIKLNEIATYYIFFCDSYYPDTYVIRITFIAEL